MPEDPNIPIPRAVGRFLGHIFQSVKNPAPESERQTISHETEEREGELGDKKVVLRRTTVDEIEFKDND